MGGIKSIAHRATRRCAARLAGQQKRVGRNSMGASTSPANVMVQTTITQRRFAYARRMATSRLLWQQLAALLCALPVTRQSRRRLS